MILGGESQIIFFSVLLVKIITMADFSPMALFEESLSSPSTSARLSAMSMLTTVSEAVGTEETIESLLPFLCGKIDDDDG